MSFYGKKFRRTHCENIDLLLASSNVHEKLAHVLKSNAPIICFTKVDEENFHIDLKTEDHHYVTTFKLGEEKEIERLDGGKVKVTYTLEAPNIIKQVIHFSDGRTIYFRRLFEDNGMKMEVTIEGSSIIGYIYFELME